MLSIKVPPLGESIVEATVSRWLKKKGDVVASGDTIVELETDKITVEVPAPKAGVLTSQAVAEGDVVKVDQLLAELDESAAGASAPARSEAPSAPVAAASTPASSAGAPVAAPPAPTSDGKSSPAARRVAADSGTDIGNVSGTGRGGVVSKPDVLDHIASAPKPETVALPPASGQTPSINTPSATAATGERETREKMSTRRKRIAENLLQSQHNTAHLTTFNEVDMSAVNA
ncbi:MAG: biotin/lipoyl-containing protein, partial [Gemmatimonadaceae bacterium]